MLHSALKYFGALAALLCVYPAQADPIEDFYRLSSSA